MRQEIFHLRRILFAACVLAACAGAGNNATAQAMPASTPASQAAAVPAVSGLPIMAPGFQVEVYALVSEPMKLAFAPDGALFVGRQPGDRIHRVGPGGHPVTEFGPPQNDPDAVLVDAAGVISGVRNAVLVGGGGTLAAIRPDQSASVVYSTGFADVDDMKFDRNGRLVFSDDVPRVLVSSGGQKEPTVLFDTPSRPGSIAIDERNRIFVALADGTIRIYNPDGSVFDGAFATGLAGGLDTYLAFGPGDGGFGRELYVLSGSNLLRLNRNGMANVIGIGFGIGPSSGTGLVFGPDRGLYVSDYAHNRILRITRGDGH